MSNKIGAKIVLEGEIEYKRAIKSINIEQKELRSELKMLSSDFAGQQNSIEALTKKNEILTKQYDSQKRKVDIYSKAVKDASKQEQEAGEKVETLKTALDTAKKEMEEMSKSSDVSKEALKKQEEAVKKLEEELAKAEQSYDSAQRTTNEWQTSLNNAKIAEKSLEDELAENNKYLKEAEKSTDDTAKSIDEYGNEVDDAKDKTSTFGEVLKANLAADIIKKSVEALVDSIKKISTAAIEVGKGFESGMSQVAATMGITTDAINAGSKDFEMLSKAAQDAGKSTQFSASQSAEALNYLALAGYDATKACETLPSVLNLAAAGGLDLAYASDLVTDSMAALGLSTEELDKYIDEMATTSQKSNTSVGQLGEATLTCAGSVSLTGQSLETMNAELGVLANNGLKGAEGGTHLRNVLLSLIAPTDKGAAALKTLGVSVNDNSGNMRDLNDIMTDLNKSMSNMSTSERTNFINRIFNKTDIGAVNALLKGTGQEFDNLKGELSKCKGAAADMATTMNDNLAGKVTILQSALEGLGISAYEKIEGTLKESVDAATESVGNLQVAMDSGELGRAMDDFSDALGDAAKGAVEFAEDALPVMIDGLTWVLENADLITAGIAGITAAEIAHGTIIPIVTATMEAWKLYKIENEGATIAQWALNTAMEANPAGLLVTAIVGITTAVATYAIASKDATTKEEEFAKATEDMAARLQNNAQKRKESAEAYQIEATTAVNLKNELIQLTQEEGYATEKKEDMARIISELNQLVPELNLYYDEEKQALSMTNEELERYLDNSLKQAEIGAMEEQLADVVRDYTEAKQQLTKAEQENNAVQEEATKFLEDLTAAQMEGAEAVAIFEQTLGTTAEKAFEEYRIKTEATTQALEDATEATDKLEQEYNELFDQKERAIDTLEKERKAQEELLTTQINYKGQVYEVSHAVASSMETIQQAYDEAREKAYESLTAQVGLFDDLSVKSDLTVNQMKTNLDHQTEAFNTYTDDLQQASKLVEKGVLDEGMLGSIKKLGMDGAGYLHELVIAAEGDTKAFNELMITWAEMSEAKQQLADTMGDIETGYSTAMDSLIRLSDQKNKAFSSGVVKHYEDMTVEIEKKLGISNGISSKFKEMGLSMDKGMEKGLLEGQTSLNATAKKVANSAYESAKDALEIHSPSKKFGYLGEMSAKGYENELLEGMEDTKEKVHEAMDDITSYENNITFDAHENFASVLSDIIIQSEQMKEAVLNTSESLATEETNIEKSRKALLEYVSGEVDLSNASEDTILQLDKLGETYLKLEEESIKSIESQVKLFDKLEMKSEMSASQMVDNLKSQIDYFNTYASDLTKAAGLVEQGLLDKGILGAIQTMGLDGAKYLHELVDAASKDTDSFNGVMEEWSNMQTAKQNLSSTMTTIKMLYGGGLDEVISTQNTKGTEIEKSINNTSENVKANVDDSFKALVSTTKSSIDDMTSAVIEKTPEFETVNKDLCSSALDSCKETLMIDESGVSKSFVTYGYSIPEGIAQGITENQDVISKALQNALNSASSSIDLSGLLEKINVGLGEMLS